MKTFNSKVSMIVASLMLVSLVGCASTKGPDAKAAAYTDVAQTQVKPKKDKNARFDGAYRNTCCVTTINTSSRNRAPLSYSVGPNVVTDGGW